ncbi:peptide deformylase [Candidatus Omnitrophota bacterium]
MTVLEVRKYPDPILRARCKEVEVIDGEIRRLFDDMVMTMHAVKGIGIAANQVGIDLRLIVVDVGDGIIKLANPEIVSKEGSSVLEEGCLSVPNLNVKVKRCSKLDVKGLNIDGKLEVISAKGLLAHAFQQEIDHINGKLIIDYLPFYKKILFKRRFAAR